MGRFLLSFKRIKCGCFFISKECFTKKIFCDNWIVFMLFFIQSDSRLFNRFCDKIAKNKLIFFFSWNFKEILQFQWMYISHSIDKVCAFSRKLHTQRLIDERFMRFLINAIFFCVFFPFNLNWWLYDKISDAMLTKHRNIWPLNKATHTKYTDKKK